MSPSSAGRQRRSLPRSGSPFWGAFLFANVPECSDASDGTWEDAPGKMPTGGASGQSRRKGPLPLCRARRLPVYAGRPGKDGRASRQGTHRGASPHDSPAAGARGDSSRASPVGLSATGMEQGRRAPLLRPCHRSATGRLRREDGSAGGERSALLPSGLAICGLLVYGSSFIEAHSGSGPGCPAMRYGAFFVVFRSWGRGRRQAGLQGLGRCGRSQPFWRIEKWLTSA